MDHNDPAVANAVLGMMALLPMFFLIFVAIIIIPAWQICKKAGFSPWLSLMILVPFGGLVLLYVLAFAQWRVVPAPQAAWPQQPPYPPYPPQS